MTGPRLAIFVALVCVAFSQSASRQRAIESESESGGVPLAKTPAREDKRVIANLRKRLVKRAPGGGREDHIGEGPLWYDRFHSAARRAAGQERQQRRSHE